MKPASNLVINIGKGHICMTSAQLVIWLHRCSGSAAVTIKAMSQARNFGTLPEMYLHLKNTHAARVQLANSINVCSARYEGKTGRHIGTLASAHNWNVAINA
jgi:hypothetical protein